MPVFWLAAHDGSSIFKCEAPDVPRAFELLARSLQYDSFAAFATATGRSPADYQVAVIEVDHTEYDSEGNRKEIKTQEDNTVVTAFRQLLRRG